MLYCNDLVFCEFSRPSLSSIAINNQDHAKRLFRKTYGMSMRDYRNGMPATCRDT